MTASFNQMYDPQIRLPHARVYLSFGFTDQLASFLEKWLLFVFPPSPAPGAPDKNSVVIRIRKFFLKVRKTHVRALNEEGRRQKAYLGLPLGLGCGRIGA